MYTQSIADLTHPPVNRDMKVLDRSFFRKPIQLSALTILNPKDISGVRSKIASSKDLLSAANVRSVRDDDTTPGAKCLLLQPRVKAEDSSTWSDQLSSLLTSKTATIRPYELELTYDDWSMSEILDAILPPLSEDDSQNPSGFTQSGHVAHVNLRSEFLPYKYLIGQVLMDKNPSVRTVINKVQDVGAESEFRTFQWELLAGVNDLNITVRHAECKFTFNLGEVYWNSRLETEHNRLLATFEQGQAVCDVMAGVGPFAVPAAKRGVWVRANDLNPASYEGMVSAAKINKADHFLKAYNMDGRDFIRSASKALLTEQRSFTSRPNIKPSRLATAEEKQRNAEFITLNSKIIHEPPTFDHFIMNLPATAVEFLDAYTGLYRGQEDLFRERKLPMIHVYAFQRRDLGDSEENEKKELLNTVSQHLGHQLNVQDDEVYMHRARLVAPKKLYYCVSFRLPAAVAFAPKTAESDTK